MMPYINTIAAKKYGLYIIGKHSRQAFGKKGALIIDTIKKEQTAIINKSNTTHSTKIGAYRFVNNERITTQMLIQSLQRQCSENVKLRHVICLQDTTEYNYQHHNKRIKTGSLGTIRNSIDIGFLSHLMICFDSVSTIPLGIPYCKLWSREPGRADTYERKYKSLLIEEKESYRWIESSDVTKTLLSEAAHITFISDRESDIYEYWSRIPDQRTDLIIRSRTDRNLYDKSSTIYSTVEEQKIAGSYFIKIKGDKRKKTTTRDVKLNIKFKEVKIRKPNLGKRKLTKDPDSITLTIIQAKEDNTTIKLNEEDVLWMLLTTHKVENFEKAKQIVEWYCFRWQIEQFFRITKKEGLAVEDIQIEKGEAIMKNMLLCLPVALKILSLTLTREGKHNDEAGKYFEEEEIEVLNIINKTIPASTLKQQNPFHENTLSWAGWIVARLGGYSGYKSQSPPGPITFKNGLDKLNHMVMGYKLAKNVYKE
jgi:hypothetical protein